MGFCIWGFSWLACGMEGIFRLFINLFYPGMPDIALFIISLIVSSIAIYLVAKIGGIIGGIIMAVIGAVGVPFSAGLTAPILILGIITTIVMFVFKKPTVLIIANFALFAICALCYGFA